MLSSSSVHCLENSGQRDAFQMNHHLRSGNRKEMGRICCLPHHAPCSYSHTDHVGSTREERRPAGGTCSLAGERLPRFWRAPVGTAWPEIVCLCGKATDSVWTSFYRLQSWTLLYLLPSFTEETVSEWDKDYPISLSVFPKASISSASNSLN